MSGNSSSTGQFKARQWQGRQTKDGSAGTVNLSKYSLTRYKAPRQKTTKGKDQTSVNAVVIEVLDSEDKGKGVAESDSEEDTQLGLVWGSPGLPDTALQDSDVEEDNIPFSELKEKKADKQQTIECVGKVRKEKSYPYVFMPETEDQASATVEETTVVMEEVPSGEKCVGQKIVKEFT